jgi:hypothetical protein
MNDSDRKRLFDTLLGDVSDLEPTCTARRVLEECALGQLNAIEVIVDGIYYRGVSHGIELVSQTKESAS